MLPYLGNKADAATTICNSNSGCVSMAWRADLIRLYDGRAVITTQIFLFLIYILPIYERPFF